MLVVQEKATRKGQSIIKGNLGHVWLPGCICHALHEGAWLGLAWLSSCKNELKCVFGVLHETRQAQLRFCLVCCMCGCMRDAAYNICCLVGCMMWVLVHVCKKYNFSDMHSRLDIFAD